MVSIAVMVHRRPGSGPRSSYITPEGAKRLRDAAPLTAEGLAGGGFAEREVVVLDAPARRLRIGSAELSP